MFGRHGVVGASLDAPALRIPPIRRETPVCQASTDPTTVTGLDSSQTLQQARTGERFGTFLGDSQVYMSSTGLRDVTNLAQGDRVGKLTRHSDESIRVDVPVDVTSTPWKDAFEPVTPNEVFEKNSAPYVSVMDGGSLQKLVTSRMLDAEQRLRRVLEQEGWTPSPRKVRLQPEYSPGMGPTFSPLSRQSSPYSARASSTSPAAESRVRAPGQSETTARHLCSTASPSHGADQFQSSREQMSAGVCSLPGNQSDIPAEEAQCEAERDISSTFRKGQELQLSEHREQVPLDCKKLENKSDQSLHRLGQGTASTSKSCDFSSHFEQYLPNQETIGPYAAAGEVIPSTDTSASDNHQPSSYSTGSVNQRVMTNSCSVIATGRQPGVDELHSKSVHFGNGSFMKLEEEHRTPQKGTNVQSHISMEVGDLQEPLRHYIPGHRTSSDTVRQICSGSLKILRNIFSKLHQMTDSICKRQPGFLAHVSAGWSLTLASECAAKCSNWKLSRWQTLISVYVVTLHVLVCYHMLQYLERPHAQGQFYK